MPSHLQRALITVMVVASAFTSVFAQTPKGVLGTWKLNLAKSKFNPGPAPKSMTVTYSDEGERTKIVADLVAADGTSQHWEMTPAYDGKDYPMTGNPNADTISLKRIDARRAQGTFKKDGKVVAVNTRTLSADGKTLTLVTKGTTPDGKPRTDTQAFER